jgi:ankyrin repeat protein/predicted nucleotidyltransferase
LTLLLKSNIDIKSQLLVEDSLINEVSMRMHDAIDESVKIQEAVKSLSEYLAINNGSALRIVNMELEEAVKEFGNGLIYNALRFLGGCDLEEGIEPSVIEKELIVILEQEQAIEPKKKVAALEKFLAKLREWEAIGPIPDIIESDRAIAEILQEKLNSSYYIERANSTVKKEKVAASTSKVIVEAPNKLKRKSKKASKIPDDDLEKQSSNNTAAIKIARKYLPIADDRVTEIKAALQLLIATSEEVHPDRVIELLKIMHNLQKSWDLAELNEEVNKCFIKCIPYINRGYDESSIEYLNIGFGLIEERLNSLINQSQKDLIRKALRSQQSIQEWQGDFLLLIKQENSLSSSLINKKRQNAIADISYAEERSEDYYQGLKEYGEILVLLGEYENAARCYDTIMRKANGKIKCEAKAKLEELEAKVILSVSSCSANEVLRNINNYKVDNYNFEKVRSIIIKLREAGNLFLQAGEYKSAATIYQKVLTIIQSSIGLGNYIDQELFELERDIFIKFAYACNGQKKNINSLNKHEAKLRELREEQKELINNSLIEVQEKWNRDFEALLKEIVSEAETQLGSLYKCAIISIGSLARREASLYSDVDLMIVTQGQVKEEKNIVYFKALIDLIKVKIISLGEMLSLPAGVKEKEVKGKIKLHYDIAGFFPNIERAICIGTAKELIEDVAIEHQHYQYQAAIQDTILLNAGEDANKLFQEYQEILAKRNERARSSIVEQLELETFKLEKEFSEIDIKNQILRYPVLLINRLFAYYNLQISNYDKSQTITEYKIDELAKESKRRNIDLDKLEGWEDFLLYCFSKERAKGLKRWLKFGYELRIKAHYLYGSSEDDSELVYVDKGKGKGKGKIYLINEAGRHDICELEEFEELYEQEIKPLYRLVELWIKAIECKSAEELSSVLKEESVNLFQEYEKTGNIEYAMQANWYYEKAVGFDLEGTEKDWIESIKQLGNPGRQTGYRLEFVGNNQNIIRLPLKEEIEKQYLNPDNYEIEGRRNVSKVNINGHYFHIKECPEAPGMEYAVSSLSHLLFGYTTTPFSIIAKLTKGNGETIPVLISRTVIGSNLECEKEDGLKNIDGESFGLSFMRTLLTNPDDDQAGNYKVQTTQSPIGENKNRLMCIDNDHGFLEKGIEERSFFSDEKCILKSILYCSKRMQEEALEDAVKNKILNLTPQRLVDWLTKLKSRDNYNRALFSNNAQLLIKNYAVTKHGKKESLQVAIPVVFKEDMAVNLYYKLMQLQDIIKESLENNYFKILLKIDFNVASHYEKELAGSRSNSPSSRFNRLSEGQYEERAVKLKSKDAVGRAIETHVMYSLSNSKYLASQIARVNSKKLVQKQEYTPSQALDKLNDLIITINNLPKIREQIIEEGIIDAGLPLEVRQMVINGRESIGSSPFVDNIFKAIAKKYVGDIGKIKEKQRQVLELIKGQRLLKNFTKFTHLFKRVNLSGCVELRDEDLDSVLSMQTEWLDITGCSKLTLDSLTIITDKCKNLETLYISDDLTRRGNLSKKARFENLKKLSIPDCEKFDRHTNSIVSLCDNLKQLYLNDQCLIKVVTWNISILNLIKLTNCRNVDINQADKNGSTALLVATYNGHKEIVELLLEKGADIEAKSNKGNTALLFAAFNGHKEIVELLLEKGADIEAKNNNGDTALLWAAFNEHKEIVELLLEKGAAIEAKTNNGDTALLLAAKNGNKEIVELLLEKGAAIEAKSNNGNTALLLAAKNGKKEIVELLLEKGAAIEAKNEYGSTALLWAAKNGKKDIVELLLEKGAAIEAKNNNGDTALLWAAFNSHKGIVELLLEKGAAIEAKTHNGNTALLLAAKNGKKEIVELLLEKGADIQAKDKDGKTALDYAVERGNEYIVKLLMSKQNQDQNLRRSEQELVKSITGADSYLRSIFPHTTELAKLSKCRSMRAGVLLIPEDNHCLQHASNVYTIMRLIENNQISQNTIIALERKQLGNSFGMPDIISLANNMDVPDFIRDLPIYQDAKLYNLARLNGITVIGVEGKGLSASKESPLYNQVREDYMASKLIECSELGYNVIFPVGSAHVEGLKSKLESKGINVLVRNISGELRRVI